jgi:hypothetical protein
MDRISAVSRTGMRRLIALGFALMFGIAAVAGPGSGGSPQHAGPTVPSRQNSGAWYRPNLKADTGSISVRPGERTGRGRSKTNASPTSGDQ